MMLIHAGAPLEPHDLARAWSFEPVVVLAIGAAAFLYYRGSSAMLARTTRSSRSVRRSRLLFTLGLASLAVALISPLHQLGGVLFSAHMSQHELLMTVAAPLIVLGQPGAPFVWALPARTRRTMAAIMSARPLADVWQLVSGPFGAWLLHGAAIWIWHVPRFYDASVGSEVVHSFQHYSFFATAVLFWWSVIRAARGPRAGVAIFSLFTTALHTALLGALLTSIDSPVYLAYDSTLAWGLTPLEDQQLGGVIMWVPGGVPYLVAALFLFARWLKLTGPAGVPRAASPLVVVLLALLAACSDNNGSVADLTGGHPERGRAAMRKYGCQSCHEIPGVTGARSLVGPPLGGIAGRSLIGGVLTNDSDNMIAWLRDPPAHAPRTAMPNLGVTEKDARDMTAYLYTLR
jgi:putative membrane protein